MISELEKEYELLSQSLKFIVSFKNIAQTIFSYKSIFKDRSGIR